MTRPASAITRRLAQWVTAHAQRALPAPKRDWAEAMLGELHHIDNDHEALWWAVGCLVTSHLERIRSQTPVEWLPVRIVITVLLMWYVFNDLFAAALTLAYRTNSLEVARQLGRLTPGGDYRPLVPLLDAIPIWMYVISLAASMAFGVSAIRYVRRGTSPLRPFVVGFVLDIVKVALLQPFEQHTGVRGESGSPLVFCVATFLLAAAMLKRDSLAPPSRTTLRG